MANFVVITDTGMERLMDGGVSYLSSLVCHLYQNNYTPLFTSIPSNFTECTFHGYAAQATSSWSTPTTNASPPNADTTNSPLTFTATDGAVPNTVYGAYFLDPSDGSLIMAQRTNLTVPAVLDAAGKSYVLTPRLTGATYSAYP